MSKKIGIIGGGPAGVEAALEAKMGGARVTVYQNAEIYAPHPSSSELAFIAARTV